MKKFLFLVPLIAACKIERAANLAEVMVKAQVPGATCKVAKAGDDLAVCTIPGKDKILEVVAVYSKDNGFKVFPLTDDKAAQAAPAAPAPAAPAPAAPAHVAPPAAGTGSGANAPTGTGSGSGSGSAK